MDHAQSHDHPIDAPVLTFADGAIIQVVSGDPRSQDAVVVPLHAATVTITETEISAAHEDFEWAWPLADLEDAVHAPNDTWTVLMIPGIDDFGVQVAPGDVDHFRRLIDQRLGRADDAPVRPEPSAAAETWPPLFDAFEHASPVHGEESPSFADDPAPEVTTEIPVTSQPDPPIDFGLESAASGSSPWSSQTPSDEATSFEPTVASASAVSSVGETDDAGLAGLDARSISAWFGSHLVLDRVSLDMPAGQVTALIGPSGCGKSTFLRILNRMHEMIPSAKMAGEVILDGQDVYDPNRKLTDARREIGMVFQKPNPFPAMSIYDNAIASLRLTGVRATQAEKDAIVESSLTKAGLWNEVKDRLRQPGGGLSGGQQQRLCIARALAIPPRVLLMDEPCSALDPTSTRRIEETITELVAELTIVIVTHNMQQAARVSDRCAFFLAAQGTPGHIVEHGPTSMMFGSPQDPRTDDYVNGRFG